MEVRKAIRRVLNQAVRVIERPSGAPGEAWWVGIELGAAELWDNGCLDKVAAEAVASRLRNEFESALVTELGAND